MGKLSEIVAFFLLIAGVIWTLAVVVPASCTRRVIVEAEHAIGLAGSAIRCDHPSYLDATGMTCEELRAEIAKEVLCSRP